MTNVRLTTDRTSVMITSVTTRADGDDEIVRAAGASLREAVENLVARFKQLQEATLQELYDRGFIAVERDDAS